MFLNRLTLFANKLIFEETSLFFLEQAKCIAIYTTIKLKTNYAHEEMVLFFVDKNDCERKKKDTWGDIT